MAEVGVSAPAAILCRWRGPRRARRAAENRHPHAGDLALCDREPADRTHARAEHAYLALVGVTVGRRAGYAATLGVTLGLALLGLAAAFGLTAVITASPVVYATLRWLGVLYFIYLAWDAWRDGMPSATIRVESDSGFFLRGLISNVLNPKAAIFYVTVLPTFIDPARPPEGQALALTAIYVVVATAVHGTIVTLAGFLRPLLANDRLVSITSRLFAVALLGIAAWLAWSTR